MMIRANLDGAFYCTKAVLPQMFDRKDGVIVNVVSIAGQAGEPARRGGVRRGEVRHGRARAGAGERGEGQRRAGEQHLPRRDRHADPGGTGRSR